MLQIGGGELLVGSYLESVNSRAKVNFVVPNEDWTVLWEKKPGELGLDFVGFEVDDGSERRLKGHDFVYFTSFIQNKELKNYWQRLRYHLSESSVVVIADLHKDKSRSEVWREMKADGSVWLSIDLDQMGLLFIGKGRQKKDYVINFKEGFYFFHNILNL